MDSKTKHIKKDLESRIDYNKLIKKFSEEELLEAADDFVKNEFNIKGTKMYNIRFNLKNGYAELYGDAIKSSDGDEYIFTENTQVRYYDKNFKEI
jgi:hypothetical protein